MGLEERVAALEGRLRAAEDHLAILNLLNSYGPLVDSGSSEQAAALWVEGGGYSYTGGSSRETRLEAPEQLIAVYEGSGHQTLVKTGTAHLLTAPKITIDGDCASAVAYTVVVLREGDRWYIMRAAINHYALIRTTEGWRISERLNRTLTGGDESLEIMRRIIGQ
ncbi:MAG: nuclear transport factor 2 family protein [Novosphingobium sp.]